MSASGLIAADSMVPTANPPTARASRTRPCVVGGVGPIASLRPVPLPAQRRCLRANGVPVASVCFERVRKADAGCLAYLSCSAEASPWLGGRAWSPASTRPRVRGKIEGRWFVLLPDAWPRQQRLSTALVGYRSLGLRVRFWRKECRPSSSHNLLRTFAHCQRTNHGTWVYIRDIRS